MRADVGATSLFRPRETIPLSLRLSPSREISRAIVPYTNPSSAADVDDGGRRHARRSIAENRSDAARRRGRDSSAPAIDSFNAFFHGKPVRSPKLETWLSSSRWERINKIRIIYRAS